MGRLGHSKSLALTGLWGTVLWGTVLELGTEVERFLGKAVHMGHFHRPLAAFAVLDNFAVQYMPPTLYWYP